MRESQREPADERFGANLRALREREGMSQSAVAAEMTERGHTWHQQTVGRVEGGRQSVRLAEAEDLAAILHTSIDRLTWTTQEASAGIMLDQVTASAGRAWEQIVVWTGKLLYAQYQLELTVAEAERAQYHGSDRIRDLVREARAAMEMTPEGAVDQGRAEHEELRKTGAQMAGEAEDER